MKKTIYATSIVEAIILILIVVSWTLGVYAIMNDSQKLSESTGNRITAIQIARDGIEGVINIRDTNWKIFWADRTNCWNTLNYNASCIGNTTTSTDIPAASYLLSRNSQNQFILTAEGSPWNYADAWSRNTYKVEKDANAFYTQSWSIDVKPLFMRRILIWYKDNTWNASTNSNTPYMTIEAEVIWKDSIKANPRSIKLSTQITNWK